MHLGVTVPTLATLKRYGMTLAHWKELVRAQGGVCAVCGFLPRVTKRLVVDHEHVRGWKRLPPEERKRHVRGLVCSMPCNRRLLRREMTLLTAWKVVRYLKAHRDRLVESHPEN